MLGDTESIVVFILLLFAAFLFGAVVGYKFFWWIDDTYWKTKYLKATEDIDKKATEIILSMDVEMFKVEKELAERQNAKEETKEQPENDE